MSTHLKYTTVQDLEADIKNKPDSFTPIKAGAVTGPTASNYNVYANISNDKTKHEKLFGILATKSEYLQEGINILNDFVSKQRLADVGDIIYEAYALSNISFVMVKVKGHPTEVDNDTITPNRFGMIVTLAAHQYWASNVVASSDPAAAAEALRKSINNPFALSHGFVPEEIIKAEDPGYLMTYFHIVTTIGFDALACLAPVAAVAIALYRAHGTHPTKLGLDKKIPAGSDRRSEILMRCMQGIMTKTFTWGEDTVKVEELLENQDFIDKCHAMKDFLIHNATTPQSNKYNRAKKIATKFLGQNFLRHYKDRLYDDEEVSSSDPDDSGTDYDSDDGDSAKPTPAVVAPSTSTVANLIVEPKAGGAGTKDKDKNKRRVKKHNTGAKKTKDSGKPAGTPNMKNILKGALGTFA